MYGTPWPGRKASTCSMLADSRLRVDRSRNAWTDALTLSQHTRLSEKRPSSQKLALSSDSFAQLAAGGSVELGDGLERTACFETNESIEKRIMCSPSLLERWCQHVSTEQGMGQNHWPYNC